MAALHLLSHIIQSIFYCALYICVFYFLDNISHFGGYFFYYIIKHDIGLYIHADILGNIQCSDSIATQKLILKSRFSHPHSKDRNIDLFLELIIIDIFYVFFNAV